MEHLRRLQLEMGLEYGLRSVGVATILRPPATATEFLRHHLRGTYIAIQALSYLYTDIYKYISLNKTLLILALNYITLIFIWHIAIWFLYAAT